MKTYYKSTPIHNYLSGTNYQILMNDPTKEKEETVKQTFTVPELLVELKKRFGTLDSTHIIARCCLKKLS